VCAPGGDGEMQFFDSLMHVAHFVFSKDDGPTNLNERSSCIQMHCARMHQRAVATASRNEFTTTVPFGRSGVFFFSCSANVTSG